MRLVLASAMRARLDGAPALDDWAATYDQEAPRLLVGYREPVHATDWPFISVVPSRDRRDLIEQTMDGLLISLVCGVRDPDAAGDGSAGLAMVDALSEAALGLLSEPLGYEVGGETLIADSASLTAHDLAHPNYQLELAINLTILGGSDV